jgi:hypothetical protein
VQSIGWAEIGGLEKMKSVILYGSTKKVQSWFNSVVWFFTIIIWDAWYRYRYATGITGN